tara:strand:+ start:270 stop:821 length:552 start_codon:yes stop_codon:yes gene_type:complete
MARKIKLTEAQLTQIIEKVIRERNKNLREDSEGEETYNYGEDEGHDRKEEMSMEDRIDAIKDHLDHLKKDMSYDEDREDRDEKGTDFRESRKRRKTLKEDAMPDMNQTALLDCLSDALDTEVNIGSAKLRPCFDAIEAFAEGDEMKAGMHAMSCATSLGGMVNPLTFPGKMQDIYTCYMRKTS